MKEDRYIITLNAKKQIEKYDFDEIELYEGQVEGMEQHDMNEVLLINSYCATVTEYTSEPTVYVISGILEGKIYITVACIPEELEVVEEYISQSLLGA